MALKEAVQAVYNKVQTDLTTASPEELAYLSTSLEKIGGRATVYDVMEFGDDKIAEIQQVANTAIASINTDLSGITAQFESDVDGILNTALGTINGLVSTSEANINVLVGNAETAVADATANIEASVAQAESDILTATEALTDAASIANQQAINGSHFNLLFFSTFYR